MEVNYPTVDEPATPEYVLAMLREICRHSALVAVAGFVGAIICLLISPTRIRLGELQTFRDLAVALDSATARCAN